MPLRSAINGEYRAHGEGTVELRALHQRALEVWAE